MGTHQLAPGTILGRYELLLPIASGGMATVWVARLKGSRGFSKTVAVKTILPSLSDDPTFEQMFLDEASIASKIQHPNVAQIIDLGEEEEVLFLAMEWVDGESLSTLSKFSRKNGTDIPLRVGLKVVTQAAAGLHAAHELRDDDDRLLELVHRDVSPQNILVSSTGVVKIVDFGVAKAMGRGGETTAGQLKGKVPFMSPEQARGAKVDRRTDIFALGIILYRLVTGTHPFLDDTDIKTMRNIITRPVMPPRVKNPTLAPEIERVVLRALNKDPAKRQQTAAELESELEAACLAAASTVGGPIHLDEVGTFVRSTLGERDRKRRAAIRDAALKIDEAVATHSAPESLSGVMFTRMQTPPRSISQRGVLESAPESPVEYGSSSPAIPKPRISTPSIARSRPHDEVTESRAYNAETVLGKVEALAASPSEEDSDEDASTARPANVVPTDAPKEITRMGESVVTRAEPLRAALPSEPPIVSSPTLAAVEAAPSSFQHARKGRRMFAAVAVSLSAALGVGAVTLFAMSGADSNTPAKSPAAAPQPTPKSMPSAAAAEPKDPGAVIDLASLPDSPEPAKSAAPAAQAAPKYVPAASPHTAEPTAEPPKPSAPPPAQPTAVATAPTSKPVPTSTSVASKPAQTSVPVVQTPGF